MVEDAFQSLPTVFLGVARTWATYGDAVLLRAVVWSSLQVGSFSGDHGLRLWQGVLVSGVKRHPWFTAMHGAVQAALKPGNQQGLHILAVDPVDRELGSTNGNFRMQLGEGLVSRDRGDPSHASPTQLWFFVAGSLVIPRLRGPLRFFRAPIRDMGPFHGVAVLRQARAVVGDVFHPVRRLARQVFTRVEHVLRVRVYEKPLHLVVCRSPL
jgi:hypothetical protein